MSVVTYAECRTKHSRTVIAIGVVFARIPLLSSLATNGAAEVIIAATVSIVVTGCVVGLMALAERTTQHRFAMGVRRAGIALITRMTADRSANHRIETIVHMTTWVAQATVVTALERVASKTIAVFIGLTAVGGQTGVIRVTIVSLLAELTRPERPTKELRQTMVFVVASGANHALLTHVRGSTDEW